jgi:hypothetical protein
VDVNNDYQNQLECEIDRELKGLPNLSAPAGFSQRVMRALQAPAPWYSESWLRWPIGLRAASLVLLLAIFGGLCVGASYLGHWNLASAASHQFQSSFAWASPIWNTAAALSSAVVLVVKKLGTGFWAGCIVAVGLSYALCMGVGTVYFRLGLSRR